MLTLEWPILLKNGARTAVELSKSPRHLPWLLIVAVVL